MEKNIEIVVQITEQLRNSKQGRYLENIADLCKTKHVWDLTTTKAAIDKATQQQRIYTSVMNGKISYRKQKKRYHLAKRNLEIPICRQIQLQS